MQQTSTVRPVLGANSSNYSEWNIDDKWSSQEWKSHEMLGARTERPVSNKLLIDDAMDSNTATESNLSLKSRSFLDPTKTNNPIIKNGETRRWTRVHKGD